MVSTQPQALTSYKSRHELWLVGNVYWRGNLINHFWAQIPNFKSSRLNQFRFQINDYN